MMYSLKKIQAHYCVINICVILLGIFTTFSTLYARTDVFFSPGGLIKDNIIKTIISSEESIDIAAFTFTAGEIAEALFHAKERGVKIRIIIDQRQEEKRYPVSEYLTDEGFDLLFLKGNIGGSMNNTFAIFDAKLLITGSYNWTEYAEKFNHENAIFIDDSDVIKRYQEEFESLYSKSIAQRAKKLEESESYVDTSKIGAISGSSKEEVLSDLGNVHKIKDNREKGAVLGGNIATPVTEKSAEYTKTLVEKEQVKTINVSSKQYLNISFNEFDKIFGNESELNKSEKKRLWKDKFEGKYVTWTGKIGYKGIAVYDWNKVGIRHKGSNIDVQLRFDWTKKRKVLRLNMGDFITYTGRLVSLRSYFSSYRLENADVLEIK